jgi:hypothetical protein
LSRRSQKLVIFNGPLSLFLYKNGSSCEVFEVLNKLGICKSYDATLNLVKSLADYCIADARVVANDPNGFVLGYNNINLSTSIFVEQRQSAPSKVQSGTHSIIYALYNPNPNALQLSPILQCSRNPPELLLNDILPNLDQKRHLFHQFKSYVVGTLCRYHTGFKTFTDSPLIQNISRRKLPEKYVTRQFPLKVSTIDEATVTGNIAVHVNTLNTQLLLTHEQLSNLAILSINDQATNARIRGAKIICVSDINHFTRIQCLQLGIGLFHLCLNLVWAVLHTHRGSTEQDGTLSSWFVVLGKKRLGAAHPDYHTLLTALTQILDGLLLNAWEIECGFPTLSQFSASRPSPETLMKLAEQILFEHGTPLPPVDSDTDKSIPDPGRDQMHQNNRLLIHDLLYVAEVTRAISDGDFGRVEDMLGGLALIFRGCGSKNYCAEIMHFIHKMKYIWKENGFAYVAKHSGIGSS